MANSLGYCALFTFRTDLSYHSAPSSKQREKVYVVIYKCSRPINNNLDYSSKSGNVFRISFYKERKPAESASRNLRKESYQRKKPLDFRTRSPKILRMVSSQLPQSGHCLGTPLSYFIVR